MTTHTREPSFTATVTRLLVLFDLILYIPVNSFLVMLGTWDGSSRVDPALSRGQKCLAQGLNAVFPVRLEPITPLSRVKHSTTESVLLTLYQCVSAQNILTMNKCHIQYNL